MKLRRLLAFALFASEWTLPLSAGDTPSPQAELRSLQLKTRELAAKSTLLPPKFAKSFYSPVSETDSPELVQLLITRERLCQAFLSADITEQKRSIEESEQQLRSFGPKWITESAIIPTKAMQCWLIEISHQPAPDDFTQRIQTAADQIDAVRLPDTEYLPLYQLTVEHGIRSAQRLLQAATALQAAPKSPEDQQRILTETITDFFDARLLMRKYQVPPAIAQSNHDALVDRILFASDLPDTMESLFNHCVTAGKDLPNTVYPAWSTLLICFALDSPGKNPMRAAVGKRVLSSVESADRFRFLDQALTIVDRYNFPDARSRIAAAIAEMDAKDCPAGEIKLNMADTLLTGGFYSVASKYLDRSSGMPADLPGKWWVLSVRLQLAIQNARMAIATAEQTPTDIAEANPELYYWKAKAYSQTNVPAKAVETYHRFLALAPTSRLAPEATLAAGLISLNLNQPEKARQYFAQVASLYPNSKQAARARDFLAADIK